VAGDLTSEQIEQLKAMFTFFDKDGSGTVDREEILAAFSATMNARKREEKEAQEEMLKGNNTALMENKQAELSDNQVGNWISMAHIEGHHEGKEELDFSEFCALFKSTLAQDD